jgi:oligopeptide/dipeptide ABC transporter ATP-binding protein
MAEPLLEARAVGKLFPVGEGLLRQRVVGHVRAVQGVSFALAEGTTLAVVGESGCGKTTLMRLVLRQERPTSGQVFFLGADVHGLAGGPLREYRRAVQAVFQDPWSSMNPRMRVGDFVAEPLVVNEQPSRGECDRRVAEVLEQVGLRPSQATRYPHEFSGGQRQRICIARALIVRPRVIVLDEPVSSLDVSIRAQILNLLKDLQATYGLSYILVAHNLATVRFMSHQVLVMYLGEAVESGEAEAVFTEPLHPYTRALIAAALPSSPDDQGDDGTLAGEVPSPLNVPPGCPFHTRCPEAMPICSETIPAVYEASPSHRAACHLYPPAADATLTADHASSAPR